MSCQVRTHFTVGLTRLSIMLGLIVAAQAPGAEVGKEHLLNSPDGRIKVSIEMPALPGSVEKPHWSARFRGKPILSRCALGLETATDGDLLAGARILNDQTRSVDERVAVLFGKADHADNRFRERRYTLENPQHRRTELVLRCYNDAIAVRYELPARNQAGSITITNETTSFGLEGEPTAFVQYLESFTTS